MLSLKKILYIKTDDKVYLVMYSESLYKVVFGERKYVQHFEYLLSKFEYFGTKS